MKEWVEKLETIGGSRLQFNRRQAEKMGIA